MRTSQTKVFSQRPSLPGWVNLYDFLTDVITKTVSTIIQFYLKLGQSESDLDPGDIWKMALNCDFSLDFAPTLMMWVIAVYFK